MSKEEIFEKVQAIVVKHFGVKKENVTENINIKDDLSADSISIMEFVLELEEEFGTEISDEDAEKIETVGAAVEYITSHS